MNNVYAVIVEDDSYSTDVLADMLEVLNVSFTSLTEGSHLIDTIQSMPKVDVIFLDLELPNQNGFKLLKNLRENPTWDNTPVVAYTSHTSEMARARQAGFHSFLGKPLRGDLFPDQLRKILNNEAVWE